MKELGSLEGLLKEVDLVDVIQLIEMGRKTGMLLLESSRGPGRVYFEQGNPIYAEAGNWEGIDAFYTMLSWKEGRFKLDQKVLSIKQNIEHSGGQELLMEGVRLTDEMEESLRSLPAGDTILQPVESADIMEGELKEVVNSFSGGADIREALEKTGLPPFQFYPLAKTALETGCLEGQTDMALKTDLLRKIKAAIEKL
jgi:hypothetical protein